MLGQLLPLGEVEMDAADGVDGKGTWANYPVMGVGFFVGFW